MSDTCVKDAVIDIICVTTAWSLLNMSREDIQVYATINDKRYDMANTIKILIGIGISTYAIAKYL